MERRPNPRLVAGPFSRLLFCWLLPIFRRGGAREFRPRDLYEVLPENVSEPIADRLENYWRLELSDAARGLRKPSLLKAFARTFKWSFLRYAPHTFGQHVVCKVSQPLFVGLLIWHFDERSTSSILQACIYATCFVCISVLDSLFFTHVMFNLRSMGINARLACSSLIYRKIMKLPYTAKQHTRGRIMTLLSNDVVKLEFCFLFLHTFWILPLQTVLITYLIWRNVGVTSLAGVFALVAQTIPVQAFCGSIITKLRRKIAMRTDDRLLLTGEVVRGIRVIKIYTWEKPFEQFVFQARRCEVDVIAVAAYLRSVLWSVTAFAQRTPVFLTITIYVLQGHSINAYKIFTLVQFFNVLHVMMGSYFLRSVNTLSEGIASLKRIQEFLLLDEQVPNVQTLPGKDEETMIVVKDVSAMPVEKADVDILHDINLRIDRTSLYAIVGPVGAGKSSLFKLILDELKLSKGQVHIHGKLSYASQEPWLFRGTIKSNILFGEIYDEHRYEQVLKACSLLEDFDQLPYGDETDVGEDGATLSGGQNARINLARAVYKNADIYLLDDPLSAVDSRVGERLYNDCINGFLKDKTRILITHQMKYLQHADEIILINNGRIEYKGNYSSLEKSHELFKDLNVNDANDLEPDTIENIKNSMSPAQLYTVGTIDDSDNEKESKETEKLVKPQTNSGTTVFKEKVKSNENNIKIKRNIYWKYITTGGSCILPLITFVAFIIAQLMCSSCDYFIKYWTTKQSRSLNNITKFMNTSEIGATKLTENLDSYTAVYIFGALMIGIIIMSVLKMVLYSTVCKKSNRNIHNMMANNLMRTPMSFFETNDSGKIINRFSKDLSAVDERLQAMTVETIEYFFIVIGVALQIIIINEWSILVIAMMTFLFYKGRVIAIKTTRSMMRIEGQMKSPVFSHVNSSFTGILTIRACKAQSMVCKQFDAHQDNHTAAAATLQYALVAYNLYLDLVIHGFIAFITYSFVIFKDSEISGADVGLALTQVLMLTGILSRAIKLTGDIETQMVSVERLFEYTELEKEGLLNDDTCQKPSSSWPNQGKIRFEGVSLIYCQNSVPTLKNLSFVIEAGAKVGIVGRTGAGKSSLIAALFRLAKVNGAIYIDDVDTGTISLKQLRKNISILPQEPIFFSLCRTSS
ncbi:ATP-binding cassette sub-family C member 4-like isoform X2 [Phymastichus coffea]|uniref:ATP-binding cassette sub-family C member 4-like isoform X2 n=1 Tax=Phymastichus coffea TaxID=108790 RepID=UPI00273B3822|nr:ATP-binding cassette sub-family C member 4-like isoform X2 [Phymastichus coffea]